MPFIFYQNILSIHQSAFIRNLAEKHEVTLVVPKEIDETRIAHGWLVPDFGKTKIIVNPSDAELHQLLSVKDAVHVFSGIHSYALPSKVFSFAVKKHLKIGVYSEPFNLRGWKGKLRFLKYWLLGLKYDRHINFILPTGNGGRLCYEKTGFTKSKIFDWAYFTENPKLSGTKKSSDIPQLLFIGSIDERKNILPLVETCLAMDKPFVLTIIGTGHLEQELKEKIKNSDKIRYIGAVPNTQIPQYLENADALILPSIFDGWGAVVNEALMCGTPVVASDNCGASVLLQGGRGCVFSVRNNDLERVLSDFIKELPYSADKRKAIREWALQNISGEAAANYFDEIVQNVYEKTSGRPVAPWMK
ncbi:MAG: glycosyltransferase family 4 protein [Bacteroidales bacterium]|jgi:glycosyltransferase involved in cell wall biosynthesis|nr:glycosyltransferase family 4 protein [Bacteroidales bacterium]